MATVPLSGTSVRLLAEVPFSNDYKNTRWFDTKSQQTNYFFAKPIVHSMNQANFQRIEGQGSHVSVNKNIDQLWGTNYIMFQNADYNNKWFYGFVTHLEYRNRSMTNVHFQIDVFQTWCFEMNFKPSFVVREHQKLWNADGTPVVNTIDEGLDYGKNYEIVDVQNYVPYDNVFYLVIVSKSLLHAVGESQPNDIYSCINGMPQPLNYYIHPFRIQGDTPQAKIGDSNHGLSPILEVLTNIYKQDDAVNNVVSLYVTDFLGYSPAYDSGEDRFTFEDQYFGGAVIADGENANIQTIYVKDMPVYFEQLKLLDKVYDNFQSVSESKLLMYPYSVTVMDDFKGNRIELKNEYINNEYLKLEIKGSIGTSNKVSYGVPDYLTNGIDSSDEKSKVHLETALINANPNDVPILSDYLSAYLQGNRNSLENQKNSIMWNGVMGGISGGIGGVASGMAKNPVGVASAGVDVLQGAGNTVLQLQGLQAKKADINNTPPQLVKMGSNTAFDYGNGYRGVYIMKKQIKPEYRKKLTHFFNMFGYKQNEVKIPNFHTRRYWNYVQTESCIITGNFNNTDLQELKSVFDNGITFWHTDDVGNYTLDNEVI